MQNKSINVLSCFDGMSGGQIALQRAGIKVGNYYASEIDKFAIAVTQFRFPKTIQIGNIVDVTKDKLPKIDLLIGGSPCQGFSFAGKQLNFEDPRSKLFFEFVRLLKELKPKYFFLENVKMKKEYQQIITDLLGVEPIEINSALVSAQNRKRLYWTNIPNVSQPEDRGIILKDILEDGSNNIGASRGRYLVDGKRQDHKMAVAGLTEQRIELRNDNKSNCLTTVGKDNLVIQEFVDRDKAYCIDANYAKGGNPEQYFNKSRRQLVFNRPCELRDFNGNSTCHHIADAIDIKGNESIKRVYSETGKAPTLTTMGGGHREPKVLIPAAAIPKYRKLTPLECERLQTVDDDYTLVPFGNKMMSDSQRYKMLGNGWTIEVIAGIFYFIEA